MPPLKTHGHDDGFIWYILCGVFVSLVWLSFSLEVGVCTVMPTSRSLHFCSRFSLCLILFLILVVSKWNLFCFLSLPFLLLWMLVLIFLINVYYAGLVVVCPTSHCQQLL